MRKNVFLLYHTVRARLTNTSEPNIEATLNYVLVVLSVRETMLFLVMCFKTKHTEKLL